LVWTLAIAGAVALLAALLRWAARPTDTAAVADWAARCNLALHPEDRHHVGQQLRRGLGPRPRPGAQPPRPQQGPGQESA
jgi:hypothetical protein